MNIHRYKQVAEVAHLTAAHGHSSAAMCLQYSAIVHSSTVLHPSPECLQARGKTVVMQKGLLGSAKQYILYICVKGR